MRLNLYSLLKFIMVKLIVCKKILIVCSVWTLIFLAHTQYIKTQSACLEEILQYLSFKNQRRLQKFLKPAAALIKA